MTNEQIAELVVVLAQLATQAIAAYHQAAGIAITPESIAALLPNPAPLSAPDA